MNLQVIYTSITIKQQYMGFNYGNLAFEKLESTIYVDFQFSFRNAHYTVSVPLGTHRLTEKEMTITCHMRPDESTSSLTVPCIPCFSQVDSLKSVRVISWDGYTLLQMMPEHFPACIR